MFNLPNLIQTAAVAFGLGFCVGVSIRFDLVAAVRRKVRERRAESSRLQRDGAVFDHVATDPYADPIGGRKTVNLTAYRGGWIDQWGNTYTRDLIRYGDLTYPGCMRNGQQLTGLRSKFAHVAVTTSHPFHPSRVQQVVA